MNTRNVTRWVRRLSLAVLPLLLAGMLSAQAASSAAQMSAASAAAATGLGQSTVPMPTMPGQEGQQASPPAGAQATPPPGTQAAPAESHTTYPHREAQIAPARNPIPSNISSLETSDSGGQTLHVIVGRSAFISTPERLRRVYVSNPNVIESMTPTPNDLVITAKTAGTSSVVMWDEFGNSTVITASADVDVAGLRESLSQALPIDRINIEVREGKLFLSGIVGSDNEADIAARLAAAYSKDVVNSLIVDPRHKPQVQLKVRFAELDRSKLDEFGINIFGLNSQNVGSSSTQQFSAPTFNSGGSGGGGGGQNVTISDFLNLFYFNIKNGIGGSLKDLATKGILEILAEPTLMTIDGQPAKFLAGGEFPFPVVQPGSAGGTATVTVQFRQFGVKLEFVPFVNPDGTIRLKIAPEVSALDYSNVVVIAGYTIPSLSTRKAETEVELRDGQTFGISGILDKRTTDSLNKMPGIGDVPILGQLFRSKSLNHSVMELVIVVTPTIVDPLTSDAPPPPNPDWITPPGGLGNFDKNLPKSYNEKP